MKPLFVFLISLLAITSLAKPVIIPQPKSQSVSEQPVILSNSWNLKMHGEMSSDIIHMNLNEVFPGYNTPNSENVATIELWLLQDKAINKEYKKHYGKPIKKAEGYTLEIRKNHIIVSAIDLRGMLYGIHTINQLIEYRNDTRYIYPCTIKDYPTLPYRAIHNYTGKNALEEQKRLIDFMVDHKYNTLNLQLENMEFKSQPKIANPYYVQSQEEIKELIQYAKWHEIEVVPVLPTLGHTEWLFYNNQNMDLVEDPIKKSNYCPLEPRTYEVVYALYDEIMELFQPRHFHMGHDEITIHDNFPYREKSKKYTKTELFLMDLDKLFAYFEGKDISLGLWSDMFLAKGHYTDAANAESKEIAKIRRDGIKALQKKYGIPELIIYDWHYAPAKVEDFCSVDTWVDEKFTVIGATWNEPENIRNFTQKIIKEKQPGMDQTTWAGYNFSIENNDYSHPQFAAYMLAADYFWSGRNDDPSALPYDYTQRFWGYWLTKAYGDNHKQLEAQSLPQKALTTLLKPHIKATWVRKADHYECGLTLTNPLKNPYTVSMEFGKDKLDGSADITVYPNQTSSIIRTFSKQPYEDKIGLSVPLQIELKLADGKSLTIEKILKTIPNWKCPKTKTQITIDGNLSEWPAKPLYTFDTDTYIQFNDNWTPEDLSADTWWCHDRKNLYFAFKVKDDIHHCTPQIPELLWQQDSMQLALDLKEERKSWLDDHCFEWGLGLNGTEIIKTGYHTNNFCNESFYSQVETAITRKDGYTIYEFRIPKKLHKKLKIGDKIGFSFAINDNDGKNFDGGLIGAHGVYTPKNPLIYADFELE